MIRKRGLQDVKRRNRQVIIQTILENDGLSRVEIAQRTELSPSTVSTLVAELIGEGSSPKAAATPPPPGAAAPA